MAFAASPVTQAQLLWEAQIRRSITSPSGQKDLSQNVGPWTEEFGVEISVLKWLASRSGLCTPRARGVRRKLFRIVVIPRRTQDVCAAGVSHSMLVPRCCVALDSQPLDSQGLRIMPKHNDPPIAMAKPLIVQCHQIATSFPSRPHKGESLRVMLIPPPVPRKADALC